MLKTHSETKKQRVHTNTNKNIAKNTLHTPLLPYAPEQTFGLQPMIQEALLGIKYELDTEPVREH